MLKKFLIGTLFVAAFAIASTAMAYDFGTTTLKLGSKGAAVMAVQTVVGATPVDGSFGPMTKAKVMAWQASNGLTADGVFGPASMAKANAGAVVGTYPAGCTSAVGFSSTTGLPCTGGVNLPAGCTAGALFSSTTGLSCTTVGTLPAGCITTAGFSSTTGASCAGTVVIGPLTGGAGNLSSLTKLSTYNDETINEGDSGNVLALEVKADNGSDLNLTSLRLKFLHASTGSYRMDRYMNNVAVYMGSTKVGSADVADFTRDTSDNSYSGSVALSGVTVKAGQKLTLVIGVTANTTIDSTDQDSGALNWTVSTVSLRYNDATGAILTDSTVKSESIAFSSIANSGDLKLKLTESTTNPVAAVNTLSESTTTNIPMLVFKLKAEGASQDITNLTFEASSTGDSLGIADMISDFELFQGSNSIATYDATNSTATSGANTSGTVIFSDISGLTLAKDSTTTFTVKAKMKKIGTGANGALFDQGDSLTISLTNADFVNVTKTLAETTTGGDTIVTGDRTGVVTGNAQTFRSTGISLSFVNSTGTPALGASGQPDIGTYTITFDVTAFGADMYIDKTAPVVGGANASELTITTPGIASQSAVITSPTGASEKSQSFLVSQDTTQRFTITSVVTPTGTGGLTKVVLTALRYDTSDQNGTLNYSTNLTAFASPYVNLKLTN